MSWCRDQDEQVVEALTLVVCLPKVECDLTFLVNIGTIQGNASEYQLRQGPSPIIETLE